MGNNKKEAYQTLKNLIRFYAFNFLKKYQLNDYQISQILYLFNLLISECSKLLLMGILFHAQLELYVFVLIITLLLRLSTGGIHFKHYWSCFAFSTLYLSINIYILPHFCISVPLQTCLLVFCIFLCLHIGPVASVYRQSDTENRLKKYKYITASFIGIYLILILLFQSNQYLLTGFWSIILHSCQLVIAKLRKEIT